MFVAGYPIKIISGPSLISGCRGNGLSESGSVPWEEAACLHLLQIPDGQGEQHEAASQRPQAQEPEPGRPGLVVPRLQEARLRARGGEAGGAQAKETDSSRTEN